MKPSPLANTIGFIGGITLFSLTILLIALGLTYLIVQLIRLIF